MFCGGGIIVSRKEKHVFQRRRKYVVGKNAIVPILPSDVPRLVNRKNDVGSVPVKKF